MTLAQRAGAEALGSAFLLAAVVGSGIMGERLAGGNVAIALLANAIATGGALVALIVAAGPVSGAHFNPAVSLMLAARGDLPWREFPVYAAAQVIGAVAGVVAAQLMFGLPLIEFSQKLRAGPALMFSEFVATLGLLLLIASLSRHRPEAAPWAVAAYIVGAYWFTASTSFANPAVTLARCLTDSFAGIRPQDVAGFVAAQLAACVAVLPGLRSK
ncbi:aquaporin family protein [Solimonas sp. K1W22B-7]|uniref:aquaporin n=1 Tax=Solimonas sp. K1W22B-7 TaxID=2303331 RepID=UPI000E3368D1|nr:MIP/aquaporin family protein [Solimonas sp. K1W22B-7]AXQ28003.1 aquaporin family protein [Solimonas sp. K1W22B-7]